VSSGAGSTVELEAHMANVSAARRFVRSELEGRVPADAVTDLMLATSELVTNAFEHGAPQPVRLTVRSDREQASITVVSGGEGSRVPDVDDWTTAQADRISGRGLGIVREIADDIKVERSGGNVAITVHRRFPEV
jgi:anti-sigma regulatory factor (Ser/Thr protein kinase)